MQGWYNYSILSGLLGDGIFTVDGEKWREQRKVSSNEFSTRVLRDFSSVVFRKKVVKLANIVYEAANSTESMDIQVSYLTSLYKLLSWTFNKLLIMMVSEQDLFMKATLDSIFRVAFGVDLDTMCGSNEEGVKFSTAFDDASAMTLWRYVDILWKIKKALNIGSEATLKKNVRVVDEFVYKLISSKSEKMRESLDDPSVGNLSLAFLICSYTLQLLS